MKITRSIKLTNPIIISRLKEFECVTTCRLNNDTFLFSGSNDSGIKLEKYKKKLLKFRTPRPILKLDVDIEVVPCVGDASFKVMVSGGKAVDPYISRSGYIVIDKTFLFELGASGDLCISYSLTGDNMIKNGIMKVFLTHDRSAPMSYSLKRRKPCVNIFESCRLNNKDICKFKFNEMQYGEDFQYGIMEFRYDG